MNATVPVAACGGAAGDPDSGGQGDLDPISSFDSYRDLVSRGDAAARDQHRLLAGPWHHYAVSGESAGGRALDEQELLAFDSERRIQRDSLAWFDYHLRDLDNRAGSWARVRYVAGGSEPDMVDRDSWPPAGTTTLALALHADGSLDAAAPTAATLDFDADSDDPSPTIGGATLRFDLFHGPRDQAAVLARADMLAFASDVLDAPVRVAGRVRVELDVATTGLDTDFAIRLTDVAPDGTQLLIGEGIRRLELRDSFEVVSVVVPGQRYSLDVGLTSELAYTFAAGHRIGLIVSSANFPRFAVNPHTGDDFYSTPAVAVTATNSLFLDGSSRLVFDVTD